MQAVCICSSPGCDSSCYCINSIILNHTVIVDTMSLNGSQAARMSRLFSLKGKTAIITGASRGIGRECALVLGRLGCNIVVAAKSDQPQPTLPGTIHTVAEEIRALNSGAGALAFKLDVRSEDSCRACAKAAFDQFGSVDILINNASALWWQDIADTPMRKYDLITQVNVRGTFCMTSCCLPYMAKNSWGRVVTMSPAISPDYSRYAGATAYNISKMGMSMVAMGVAAEYKGKGIIANTLWPATIIESLASINFKLGDKKAWRKASIIADATAGLVCETNDFTGRMLIDDEYLRERHGFDDADFVPYRCDPNFEPGRSLAAANGSVTGHVKRGEVGRLDRDIKNSGQSALNPSKSKL